MNYMIMCDINNVIEKYSDEYIIRNDIETLNVFLQARINEESKEIFLDKLDKILPLGLIFNHEYENGKLKVIFKEIEKSL